MPPGIGIWSATPRADDAHIGQFQAGGFYPGVDPTTGALSGIFDFDDAAVAHRLEDFKYLLSFGIGFTRLALDAYAGAGGPRLSLDDVGRFHLLSALEHFLFVAEDSARWPQIVEWTRAALDCFPWRGSS